MAEMKFTRPFIPEDADAAMVWACHKEFDLRWRRWQVSRFGIAGVYMQGVIAAMRRLNLILNGER
jgi:hypothetical protein